MKNYRMKLLLLTLAAMCLCAVQASALEYTYAGVDDFLFGRPTSTRLRIPMWTGVRTWP